MYKIFALLFFVILSYSNDNIVYEDPVTGVVMSVDKNGYWRLKAFGEAEYYIGDRKDIRIARTKAILRAKKNLAYFLNERLKAKDTLMGITKDYTKSNGMGREVSQKSVETVIENIENSADAILKGLLVLDVKNDTRDKVIIVTLGISQKTLKMADRVRNAINDDLSSFQPAPENKKHKVIIQRSPNYDNF